jgi:polyhydroxyalkanoate synthase subunit PhaE
VNAGPWGEWQAFSDAARSYLDSINASSTSKAAQQFSDFLREQFGRYSQAWGFAHTPPAGAPISADPLSQTPAFGATREHQQRAQRIVDVSQRMGDAQRRLQRLWSDVLRDAATKFVSQLKPLPSGGATADSLRQLYDAWIDCAEDAYASVAHGEAFCQAQADFANAASQWRLEQQANIEHWSKFLDLPTRSEINSLTRRLRAVEEQLRIQARAATTPTQASANRRPAPLRRARSKKKRS